MKTPTAELLWIGTEVTTGRIANTNACRVAPVLEEAGFRIPRHTAVPDEPELMREAFRFAALRSNLVFVGGGLGPTLDDRTTEVLAAFAQKPIVRDAKALRRLTTRFHEKRRVVTIADLKMISVPKGAVVFPNDAGMAVGYALRVKGAWFVVTPGVPLELSTMLHAYILPFLRKSVLKSGAQHLVRRTIRLYGLPEAMIDREIRRLNLPEICKGIEISFLLSFPEVHVILTLRGREPEARLTAKIQRAEDEVGRVLGTRIVGTGDVSLAEEVHGMLLGGDTSLAVAESCTGGLLGKTLTDLAGSSKYFLGGVISYSNESKVRDLSVPLEVITAHGAVSRECVEAMAKGVRNRFSSKLGVAITGVAGPDGGTDDKPVGTVWIALAAEKEIKSKMYSFSGGRDRIRHLASYTALQFLSERLHREN